MSASGLQSEVVGLSLGYAVLGVVLLLALVRVRLPWLVKAGAIAVTSAFYIVVFFRSEGLLGWSAPQPLPARFQLLWARTVEPDLADNVPGAIHLWLEELDDANLPSGKPRAYRLPYSTSLARKVEAARVAIMKGTPQSGRAVDFGTGEGGAAPDVVAAGPMAGGRRSRARRSARSRLPRRRVQIDRVRALAGAGASGEGSAGVAMRPVVQTSHDPIYSTAKEEHASSC